MEETDFDLVRAVGQGDREAFGRLVNRHKKPLFAFILRYLGEKLATEDILQEVFLRLYRAAPRFEARAKLTSVQVTADPERNGIEAKEMRRDLLAALDGLPEKQRAALLLRVNEELSYAEIGNVLSISVASVEALIFRARTRLKQLLKESEIDEGALSGE